MRALRQRLHIVRLVAESRGRLDSARATVNDCNERNRAAGTPVDEATDLIDRASQVRNHHECGAIFMVSMPRGSLQGRCRC